MPDLAWHAFWFSLANNASATCGSADAYPWYLKAVIGLGVLAQLVCFVYIVVSIIKELRAED